MLAAYCIAVDSQNKAYVYKELYQDGLIISDAAKRIKELIGKDKIYSKLAPPDLWNRRQETGKSATDLFRENGVSLIKANNDRVQGWYNLKEWLKPYDDEQGIKTAHLVIFSNCANLIRCLPQLQRDEKDPNDVATEPHELTHGPDALRYFIAGRPRPNIQPKPEPTYNFASEKPKPRAGSITVTEDFFKGGWN
jgi:phage terminase large subunit